jgi:hypothetical protein
VEVRMGELNRVYVVTMEGRDCLVVETGPMGKAGMEHLQERLESDLRRQGMSNPVILVAVGAAEVRGPTIGIMEDMAASSAARAGGEG